MDAAELKPKQWYWIRRPDGSLAPYVFHRLQWDDRQAAPMAEFFVGSFLQRFRLNQVIAEAKMPELDRT